MFDFINSLENKWDTLIGEEGNDLSGGQNQRLGIARALFRDTEIIILDEATSALDKTTEEKILNKIYFYDNRKTIISISHDANSLKFCDKIYIVKNGNMYEK